MLRIVEHLIGQEAALYDMAFFSSPYSRRRANRTSARIVGHDDGAQPISRRSPRSRSSNRACYADIQTPSRPSSIKTQTRARHQIARDLKAVACIPAEKAVGRSVDPVRR